MATTAGGKEVETTGSMTKLNQLASGPGPAQGNGPLLLGAGMDMAGSQSGGDAEDDEAKKRAVAAQSSKKPGKASGPDPDNPQCTRPGEPVDASSGHVVSEAVDLELAGVIPLQWKRWYVSAKRLEKGQLGRGGWSHSFEQWIEPDDDDPDLFSFRNHQGRDLYFPTLAVGQVYFFRADRLTFIREREAFRVELVDQKCSLLFRRLGAGPRHWLVAIEDRYGHAIRLHYEGERLSSVSDTAGRELRLLPGADGFLRRLEVWAAPPEPEASPHGPLAPGAPPKLQRWVDYGYHETGELASVTNAVGHVARYGYDALHRIVRHVLPNGHGFYYRYDEESGRCIKTWGDGGLHEVDLAYDDATQTTLVTATSEARLYKWRGGLVIEERLPNGTLIKKVDLDDDDYIVAEENGAGEKWVWVHDARGNVVAETDPEGNTTRWTFAGDLAETLELPDGIVTKFHHDQRGRLIGIEHASGTWYRFDLDVHGRLQRLTSSQGTQGVYAYDRDHNLVLEQDARGARTAYTYDALGRALSRTDTLGRVTRAQYDALGQPVRVVAPDGTTSDREFDPLGNLKRMVDALGHAVTLDWCGTGVVSRIVQADGSTFSFEYDADERLTAIENPRAERYRLEYDAQGRVVRERAFDGRPQEYGYSRAGRLRRVDYADGTWLELVTNKLGDVVVQRSPHGTNKLERDALGRVVKATVDEHGGPVVTEIERDTFGRVIREVTTIDGVARETRHAYDPHGRRVERVLPNGETTRYWRDAAGDTTSVEHAGERFVMARDALGREVQRTGHDGAFELRQSYDALDRLVDQRVTTKGLTLTDDIRELVARRYHWDPLGRPTAIDDARWGRTSYRYDRAGWLVEAQRGKAREVFDYDPCGSLVRALGDLDHDRPHPTWTLAPGNQLKETDDATYRTDVRGRRVEKTTRAPDGTESTTRYVWDVRDHLREVHLPDGRVARYRYDAFARRVSKEVVPRERATLGTALTRVVEGGESALAPAQRTTFVWDGDVLALEERSDGGVRTFVHEPGTFLPMLQAQGGRVYAYVLDHLGTPRELIDPEGRVAWAASHAAWGALAQVSRDPQAQVAVESPFRLLGTVRGRRDGARPHTAPLLRSIHGSLAQPRPARLLRRAQSAGLRWRADDRLRPARARVQVRRLRAGSKGEGRLRGDHGAEPEGPTRAASPGWQEGRRDADHRDLRRQREPAITAGCAQHRGLGAASRRRQGARQQVTE
jgi:YD repeat-containing protein